MNIEVPPRHTPVSTRSPGTSSASTSSMHACTFSSRFMPTIVSPFSGQSFPTSRSAMSAGTTRTEPSAAALMCGRLSLREAGEGELQQLEVLLAQLCTHQTGNGSRTGRGSWWRSSSSRSPRRRMRSASMPAAINDAVASVICTPTSPRRDQ